MGAGELVAESGEVCCALEEAKWMLIWEGSSVGMELGKRSTVIGTAGLWYFNLTSSCRQNLLGGVRETVRGYLELSMCCFNIPCTHMSTVNVLSKPHVYPFNILWEDEGAGAETNGEEFRLEFAHALRQGDHSGMLSIRRL